MFQSFDEKSLVLRFGSKPKFNTLIIRSLVFRVPKTESNQLETIPQAIPKANNNFEGTF